MKRVRQRTPSPTITGATVAGLGLPLGGPHAYTGLLQLTRAPPCNNRRALVVLCVVRSLC